MSKEQNNKKWVLVNFKIRPEKREKIHKYAEDFGLTSADYIRQAIFEKMKRDDIGQAYFEKIELQSEKIKQQEAELISQTGDGLMEKLDILIKNQMRSQNERRDLKNKLDNFANGISKKMNGINSGGNLFKALVRKDFQDNPDKLVKYSNKIKECLKIPMNIQQIMITTGLSIHEVELTVKHLREAQLVEYTKNGKLMMRK